MLAASQAVASLAVLSVGVIYGTDIFSALVLRPAMATLTDRELTQAAGPSPLRRRTTVTVCSCAAALVPTRAPR
jgi:hypothetical protein